MLQHPNIVKFVGACLEYPHLCLLMEYVPYESLTKVMESETTQMSVKLIVKYMLDTSSALSYLHQVRNEMKNKQQNS